EAAREGERLVDREGLSPAQGVTREGRDGASFAARASGGAGGGGRQGGEGARAAGGAAARVDLPHAVGGELGDRTGGREAGEGAHVARQQRRLRQGEDEERRLTVDRLDPQPGRALSGAGARPEHAVERGVAGEAREERALPLGQAVEEDQLEGRVGAQ